MSDITEQVKTVASNLPNGGEARSGQLEMAQQVETTIVSGDPLFVEAGTGTGKTFAYLVPIVTANKSAVISTATIALQSQLVEDDIPMVLNALDSEIKVALLKGRNNYLCAQKLLELETDDDQLELIPKPAQPDLKQILKWAQTTRTGDKEELTDLPDFSLWDLVSVKGEECPGAKNCPSGESCFSEKARRKAEAADLVVTNHHYYGLNLASEGALLPEHEIVVFDEAHQLPQILEVTCGLELSGRSLTGLARRARATLTEAKYATALEDLAEDLEDHLRDHVGEALVIGGDLLKLFDQIRAAASALLSALQALTPTQGSEVAAKVTRNLLLATKLINDVDKFLTFSRKSSLSKKEARKQQVTEVVWVAGGRKYAALTLTPLGFAKLAQTHLWDTKSAILTSATLTDAIVDQLGADTTVQRIASPYDYAEQGLLYCPTDLPNPNSADFRDKSQGRMIELVKAAGGRALVLFTSFSALNEAAERFENELDTTVYVQGNGSKQSLLQKFRNEPDSILLATMSFWQGVDVPGESLTLVMIDRIPFPRPDDPVLQAKRDSAGAGAFAAVDLPRAQTLLAQASGRLIRGRTDKGVVAVLDPRLAKNRSYRWELIQSLPAFRRTKDFKEVETMLKTLDKQHKEA